MDTKICCGLGFLILIQKLKTSNWHYHFDLKAYHKCEVCTLTLRINRPENKHLSNGPN